MIFIYVLLSGIFLLFLTLIKKIDTAIELIFNKLNIDSDIWGSDKDV